MEKLEVFFPLSLMVQAGAVRELVVSLAIYLAVCGVLGLLHKFLGWIPLAGSVVKLVSSLGGMYSVVGIVLAIWRFVQ